MSINTGDFLYSLVAGIAGGLFIPFFFMVVVMGFAENILGYAKVKEMNTSNYWFFSVIIAIVCFFIVY